MVEIVPVPLHTYKSGVIQSFVSRHKIGGTISDKSFRVALNRVLRAYTFFTLIQSRGLPLQRIILLRCPESLQVSNVAQNHNGLRSRGKHPHPFSSTAKISYWIFSSEMSSLNSLTIGSKTEIVLKSPTTE